MLRPAIILRSLFCAWLFCSSAVNAASSDLIEGARHERELVLYASLTTEEANVLLPKFEAKYPFLKVQFVRSGSERLLTRVLARPRMNCMPLFLPMICSMPPNQSTFVPSIIIFPFKAGNRRS